jgi:hypothetical protein
MGGIVLALHHSWLGAVLVLFGFALIVEGIYQRSAGDPEVIRVSAATLAAMALWNFGLLGFGGGVEALLWAIAQCVGAYTTWADYSTYKTLREQSDSVTVEEVRGYVNELRQAKPDQTIDLIEFDVHPSLAGRLAECTARYRLKPFEDLYLMTRYKVQVGPLELEEISFVPRAQVTVASEGEKGMSHKIKTSVQLGQTKLENVAITPEMVKRLRPAARKRVPA